MPLQTVKKGGQTCYRWGDSGKIYCGPGGKKKAEKQGVAIEISKKAHGELCEQIKKYLSDR